MTVSQSSLSEVCFQSLYGEDVQTVRIQQWEHASAIRVTVWLKGITGGRMGERVGGNYWLGYEINNTSSEQDNASVVYHHCFYFNASRRFGSLGWKALAQHWSLPHLTEYVSVGLLAMTESEGEHKKLQLQFKHSFLSSHCFVHNWTQKILLSWRKVQNLMAQ